MYNLYFHTLIKRGILLFFIFFTINTSGQNISPNADTTVCGSITLTAPGSATYEWKQSINNGVSWTSIAGATAQTYTVTQSGLYTVITSPATLDTVLITVNPKPVVGFTIVSNNLCPSVPVFFNNTTTSANNFLWYFDDINSGSNNTSTLNSPTHKFIGNAGTGTQNYNVKLVASSNAGCKDSTTLTATVKQRPGTELNGTGSSTFNNLSFFKLCGTSSSDFNFVNISSTTSTNTGYNIKWGDATPDANMPTFSAPITHNYSIGSHTLLYSVTGNNGCTDTASYFVFVGSNPAVGLGNPGNTTICTKDSLTFPVNNTSGNTPGTMYTITINDNTAPFSFNPIGVNPSFTHVFNISSCGVNSSDGANTYSNSYSARITASNPCGTSAANIVPIYVSKKPEPAFSILPSDTTCVNKNITFTNTGGNNNYVDNGTCNNGKNVWSITPTTGWNIVSGTTGDTFGFSDPSLWATGTNAIQIKFTSPGVYTIKLQAGNPKCGAAEIIKTVCVNPQPTANFTVDNSNGCAPLTVNTTNASSTPICGTNKFFWSVTYSPASGCTPNTSSYFYLDGTSNSSQNPKLKFDNPGTYTIGLYIQNGDCTSSTVFKQITVKGKPSVSAINASNVCQNGSTSPTVTVGNCNTSGLPTYAWSFPGGNPTSSTQPTPGNVTYTTFGTPTISLDVTNECGTTNVIKTITVSAAPTVVVPSNKTFCAGDATGMLNFSSSVSTANYTWTNSNTAIGLNASGSASSSNPFINSFIAQNNTASPITATITVTPVSGCSGIPQTFTITVNPKPTLPVVVSPINYCLNEVATALNASATGGNTLMWYNNAALLNGTVTAYTPLTTSTGTTNYYVTQENSYGCKSSAATISVTVVPIISNNTIGNNQTICAGATPNTLTQTSTTTGGTGVYTYQWQQSTDGGLTWSSIIGANTSSYLPIGISVNTQFRRIVLSACSDTSNVISITILGVLNNTGVSAAQVICQGNTPAMLDGDTPNGGNGTFNFTWEQSTNNTTWSIISGITTEDYQPPALNVTTYYRRKTESGSCAAYSASIKITVNPKPVITPIANTTLCNSITTTPIVFTSTPNTGVTYVWQNDNIDIGLPLTGSGNIAAYSTTNNSSPKVPIIGNISVVPTYTFSSVACLGDTGKFSITILPTISINAVADTTICSGSSLPAKTFIHDAGSYAGTNVTYQYTISGSGTSLVSGTGSTVPAYTANNVGNTNLTTTVTVKPVYTFNGKSCDGIAETYTITITPSTPTAAAGNDTILCSANTYTMQATLAGGSTGVWSEFGGNSTNIQNTTSPTTQITGLLPNNTYKYVWNVTGVASCPGTSDTITIINYASVVNQIDNTTKVICATQTININGNSPTGGSGSYTYQWQQSTDGGLTWTNIPFKTSKDLSYIPTTSVLIRRIVYSLPCIEQSSTTIVTVQPAISNNTISANQSICINTVPTTLIGTVATGGDGNISYQWQLSTNGGITWSDISGATSKDFSPSALTVTTKYRRVVSTSLCFGTQGNNSLAITITVNPDSHANYTFTNNIGCAPFLINSINIKPTLLPLQNGTYNWYANNTYLVGGPSFPGFTLTNPGDSIQIKLVTTSPFGCKADSVTHKFYTVAKPQTSFTASDTIGCGPLNVLFTNTTPNINWFNYQWSFGNGLTSNLPQPNTVTFATNPTFFDTIYTVQLSATTVCQTVKDTQYIRVKSKPKAVFTPNKSVGCSPMTVFFNNTSKGNNVQYKWNFGDGGADTLVTTKSSMSYTYYRGFQDTVDVRLIAFNDCGSDTQTYKIVISPNLIQLDFAVNGNETQGCKPKSVKFINASNGATNFFWSFGDGNTLSTTKNIDTVTHTYTTAGTFIATLKASNNCSDTTSVETIQIFNTPIINFTAVPSSICIGDTIHFTNLTDTASSYLWSFNDNSTSTLVNPKHIYPVAGNYLVQLKALRQYNSGLTCIDSISKPISVVSKLKGSFTANDTISPCVPFTLSMVNNTPALQTIWYSNNIPIDTGNVATYTFNQVGSYLIKMNATNAAGCIKEDTQTVVVRGPSGTFQYDHGIICSNNAVYFEVLPSNTDSIKFNFGDGNFLTTTANSVYHQYNQTGSFIPSVILYSNFSPACTVTLQGTDTIKIDYVKAGFKYSSQTYCDSTKIFFNDTSRHALPIVSWQWNFGDGNFSTLQHPTHTYKNTNNWAVQLITKTVGGCTDTVNYNLFVKVNNKPSNTILAPLVACALKPINYQAQTTSVDSIVFNNWQFNNGLTTLGNNVNNTYILPGTYYATLISGTAYGCTDTALHTIIINPTPTVVATSNQIICLGSSIQLNVSGANTYSWAPINNTLSCLTCINPIATPITSTMYIVEGTNTFGCSNKDSVMVTVAQPITIQTSANDTICIGQSAQLSATGATTYQWLPSSSLQNNNTANPIATPAITTTYQVIGFDNYNCFQDTGFITVAVGKYPTITLEADKVLPTGTQLALKSTVTNGPITNWLWTPSADLNCNTCALPIATIKNDVCYTVTAANIYHCAATDTICIKTFCEGTQVFIPNAFTPDGDGINDVLMVRGSGIKTVKSFRIFNRWGQVVFEKTNVTPNDPAQGWNGTINGKPASPEVYVYTCEVVCENNVAYTYKGNVAIIK